MVWDTLVERFLLHTARPTILLTNAWVDYLKANRLPWEHTVVIPNCINTDEILVADENRRDRTEPGPVILSVGRLDPVKRIDDAFRALAQPELSEASLHVVGEGPDRERLVSAALEVRVENRVIFHGVVDDVKVAALAAHADVFVLPSEQEGLPTVLLEMLYRGLPVVCSDIPGNQAILSRLGLKTAFPVGDVRELARLVFETAGSRVSSEVHQALREHFTWQSVAPKVAALYATYRIAKDDTT